MDRNESPRKTTMTTVIECRPPAAAQPTPEVAPDFTTIKQRQQATWSAGDYAVIGTTLQIVGERLCEAVDLRAGERVLDVAAGNGNATLAAARRFASVTSTDYVDDLLARGKERLMQSVWSSPSGRQTLRHCHLRMPPSTWSYQLSA